MGNLDGGVHVKAPDVSAEVDAPDVDVSAGAEGEIDLSAGGDVDVGKPKGGFKFGLKMPKFHGPSFGGGIKANADLPDADIDAGAKVDLDGGVDVKTPDASAEVDVPDVDVSAKVDAPDVDLSAGAGGDIDLSAGGDVDVEKPKGGFKFGFKMPKLSGPSFSGGVKGGVKGDLDVDAGAKADLDGGVDVKTPDVSAKVDAPDVEVSAGA